MVKGGARPHSGPAPNLNALARNRDGADWTRLPATGRQGDIPEWPVEVDEPSLKEIALWRRLWRMPQAIVWEADQAHNTVALYCRVWIRSMEEYAQGTIITHAKTLATELMLTPDSLTRGKYVIKGTKEDAAITAAMAQHPAVAGSTGSGEMPVAAKNRLFVVPAEMQPEEAPAVDPTEGEGADDDDDDVPPF